MRSIRGTSLFIAALLILSPVVAQPENASACDQLDELKAEAQKRLKQAESQEERQQIEEEYADPIQKLENECGSEVNEVPPEEAESETENLPGERIEKKEAGVSMPDEDLLSAEKCRKRATDIRNQFISNFKEASFTQTRKPVENFMSKRNQLVERCKIFKEQENPEEQEHRGPSDVSERKPRKVPKEEIPELEYSLEEEFPDRCRKKIEKMKKRYMKKIMQNRESEKKMSNLREEFYSKVERKLEGCKPKGPKIVNVSEAPEMMTDGCKSRVRKLNKRIKSETDASIGSTVPESYRDEYRDALRSCVTSAATQKVKRKVAEQVLGGEQKSEGKLRAKLDRKERRIEQLEQKVNQLRNRLETPESGKTQEPSSPKPEAGTPPGPVEDSESQQSGSTESVPGGEQQQQAPPENRENKQGNGAKTGILASITGILR